MECEKTEAGIKLNLRSKHSSGFHLLLFRTMDAARIFDLIFVLTGPGQAALDVSLAKSIDLSGLFEEANLQFRAEFFNVLNRANFYIPNLNVFTDASGNPSAAAGKIFKTSTTSRQIQLGLKLTW